MIVVFVLLILAPLNSGQEFCGKRFRREAADRNADWYPESCVIEDQPRGQRCHLRCKEGYLFKEGSLMFTDCINTDNMRWSDLNLSSDICVQPSTNCTVPEEPGLYNCKAGQSVLKGTICYFEACASDLRVGPSYIQCQSNGEWFGNGSYCKAKPVTKMGCPNTKKTIQTDIRSSTVDARRYLDLPKLPELNPSQLEIKISPNSIDISALVVGQHHLKYTVTRPDSEEDSCDVVVDVEDDEPPMVLDCVEEVERFSVPKYSVEIQPSNCTFQDNVDGIIPGKYDDPRRLGNLIIPGVHSVTSYKATDSSGNEEKSPVVYTVRAKDCSASYPVENTAVTNIYSNTYAAQCVNTNVSYMRSYADPFGSKLPFSSLFEATTVIWQAINACNATTFILKEPVLECFHKYQPQNDTCPIGQVKDKDSKFCIPCPKSFYYNQSSSGPECLLCPVNTTTNIQGSSVCVPCPKNSMAVRTAGPRRCEYFCKPGEAYTSFGCMTCGTGEYVEAGGEKCLACPQNTTTLKNRVTSASDCVPGVALPTIQGEFGVVGTPNHTFYFRFNITSQQMPGNQLEQRAGFRFTSAALSAQMNCSKEYAQVIGYFGDVENPLTGKLCGKALEDIHVVKFRPWRVNVIRYFSSNSQMDLKVSYGVGAKLCQSGMVFNVTSQQCEKCAVGTFQERFNGFECQQCANGKTNYDEGQTFCIDPCPVGFGGNGTKCIPCPMNTYEKNSTCVQCPTGTATSFERSTQCTKACAAGEFLSNGTCVKCPHGTYQPLTRHSQTVCWYCTASYTTLSNGSTSNESCVSQCHYEGEYYNTTLKSCQRCPRGAYKVASAFTVSQCVQCPDGLTTKASGSIRKSNCRKEKTICDINNPCVFPGQCAENGTNTRCICPKFHTGQFCETVDGPCSTSPCQNNGTCHPISQTNNYTCLCKPGYTGRHCSSEHDPCDPNPCYQANCTAVTLQSKIDYNCSCRIYWSGKRCTQQLPRPCSNSSNCVRGTCDDDPTVHGIHNYTCTCDRGYEGAKCDIKIIHCNNKPCDVNGTQECKEEAIGDRTCVCKAGYYGETCNEFKKCVAGEFYYQKACCKCWHGTYNTESNAEHECKKCSDGQSTLSRGATSQNQCEAVERRERFGAEILLLDRTYQGKLVKEGCGALPSDLEEQLKQVMKSKDVKNVEFRVDEYLAPPQGKSGLMVHFTVFGDTENNERILKEAVRSGTIGKLSVDKDVLEIKDRNTGGDKKKPDEKKKTSRMWIYITMPIVALLLIVIIIFLYKKQTKTSPKLKNYNLADSGDMKGSYDLKMSAT